MEFQHTSVMLTETITQLNVKPEGIYLDGTLGGGGHSWEIASMLKGGHLYGMDQDGDAIAAAKKRLAPFEEKVTLIRDNFANAKEALAVYGVNQVNGILVDLGVSSFQLDEPDRGFSYRFDAPLDMRMDRRRELTAKDIINHYSEKELFRMIRDYGEERFAQNIAKHILRARADKEIQTTYELNDIIKAAIPAKMRTDGHPSKRTYQAIRIECNEELTILQQALKDFADLLAPEGRLCVITFHSLEDRITKNTFRTLENPCICPPDFPVCVCGRVSSGKVITKKPIYPTSQELDLNPRSKSAKLRVFQKTKLPIRDKTAGIASNQT
jgi:16S rRNA (cytosine1402-N4)-methyltransferase